MRASFILVWVVMLLMQALKMQADSPLTSCHIAQAYRDQPMVKSLLERRATSEGPILLTPEITQYLLNELVPIDMRMAAINALGFGQKDNPSRLLEHLTSKYKLEDVPLQRMLREGQWVELSQQLKSGEITGSDFLAMAYLLAMSEYLNPRGGLPFAAEAMRLLQDHETATWISNLIMAQFVMEVDECEVFVMFRELNNKTFTTGALRNEAKRWVMDYIVLYQDACLPDPYSEAYYQLFPVYDTLSEGQVSSAAKFIDLHFVGAVEGILSQEGFIDNRGEDGGKVLVEVRNSGNTPNVPTNVYVVMYIENEGIEERLIRQVGVPPIKANKSEILELFLPHIWWQAGSGRMEIFVDQANRIEERNEDNNRVEMAPR
jgi:CARDB